MSEYIIRWEDTSDKKANVEIGPLQHARDALNVYTDLHTSERKVLILENGAEITYLDLWLFANPERY